MSQPNRPLVPTLRAAILSPAERASLAMMRQTGTISEVPRCLPETRGSIQTPPPTPILSSTSVTQDQPSDVLAHELIDKLAYEIDFFGSFALNARTGLSHIGKILCRAAFGKQRPFIPEDEYIPLTAQSPIHTFANKHTRTWIVTRFGILGEPPVSPNQKLGPGAIVRLCDTSLAIRHYGFEKPWLFAVVGRALRREPGYHVFAASPHVCIYTGEPHPINIDHVIIAIPDLLLYEAAKLTGSTHAPSIGQHIISDRPYVYAPLRPWEEDPSWQHPES
jgi:hypothetical protein